MPSVLRELLVRPGERDLSHVPRPVFLLIAIALAAQIAWHAARPAPRAAAQDLPAPPSIDALRVMALAEEQAFARLLMYWLQAFDNQPGISIPFRNLDYLRVTAWLDRILALDPGFNYPLLSAARIYGEVPDESRRRQMLEFVRRHFREAPDTRWPWQAHGVYIARHRINDPELALDMARELRALATGPAVPHWAQQLELFVLDDMGESEGARVLLGGLIESGALTDPNEIRFLMERLETNKR